MEMWTSFEFLLCELCPVVRDVPSVICATRLNKSRKKLWYKAIYKARQGIVFTPCIRRIVYFEFIISLLKQTWAQGKSLKKEQSKSLSDKAFFTEESLSCSKFMEQISCSKLFQIETLKRLLPLKRLACPLNAFQSNKCF